MANPGVLRLIGGTVVLYNLSGQRIRTYYPGTDATRADWFDVENESVQVQLKDGRMVLVNKSCQIYKRLN